MEVIRDKSALAPKETTKIKITKREELRKLHSGEKLEQDNVVIEYEPKDD